MIHLSRSGTELRWEKILKEMSLCVHVCSCVFLCVFLTRSLHGSPLLDAGLVTLNTALSTHPSLVSLDLGDCMLGDEAVRLICGMLPPDGAKSGIISKAFKSLILFQLYIRFLLRPASAVDKQ